MEPNPVTIVVIDDEETIAMAIKAVLEQAGYRVRLYPGAYDNMKITTAQDLDLAEVLLLRQER